MSVLHAIILGIVEGVTEFLPISSTGHMIIVQGFLGVDTSDTFVQLFTVVIQLGAIFAVVWLYAKTFFSWNKALYVRLAIAIAPALIIGGIFGNFIEEHLFTTGVVASSLIIGGVIFLYVEKLWPAKNPSTQREVPAKKKAFIIGLWQCIALIPGTSRSAATIVGGLQQGLSREKATEFSFLLAVPTMCAATGYSILKLFMQEGNHAILSSANILTLCVGIVTAFIVALIAVKTFIRIIAQYGFKVFGWYRIIVGAILIAFIATNYL